MVGLHGGAVTNVGRASRRRSLCLGLYALGLLAAAGCTMPAPLRVMSFNIRYGAAQDGADNWPLRRELVFDTIRAYDPDLIGLQEVLVFQKDELIEALPDYDFVGVGRSDGRAAGEFAPVMFRRKMFTLIGSGVFWLSDEPEKIGSRGWDAALPRIATWVKLQFKSRPLNHIWLYNTHFDHRGERARLESAKLMRRAIEAQGGVPIIVTGDFNAGPASEPYRILTENTGNLAHMLDSYTQWRMPEENAGTFNAFRGERGGPRIDWILHNRRFKTREAAIDRAALGDRYPSDHFPVTATLELIAKTRWGGM